MHMSSRFAVALLFVPAAFAGSQQLPPIRPLGPIVATSSEPLGALVFARHLPAGVLVNDVSNRRLVLLDSALSHPSVIADTTPATANGYSGRSAAMIAYHGDSTLFVDAASLSMLVIDPAGKIVRTMAVPRSQDAVFLGNAMFG